MQIHELNNYNGDLNGSAYLAIDNGNDTGKISAESLLYDVTRDVEDLDSSLNARIDNIIGGGDAPSVAEVTDARLGANGIIYPSLGASIRGQINELATGSVNLFNNEFEAGNIANNGVIDSATNVFHSGKIPVNPSTEYSLKMFGDNPNIYRANLIFMYSAADVFVGKVSTTDAEMRGKTFTTDQAAAYIRFRTSSPATEAEAKRQKYMFVQGSEPADYVPGGYTFNIADDSISRSKLAFPLPETIYNYIYDKPVAHDGSDPSGFDADNLTTAEVYAAYDALVSSLPSNAKKTLLGKDQSGTFDIYQYDFYQPYTNISNSGGSVVDSSPHMAMTVILTSGTHGNGAGGDNTDSIISLYEFIKEIYTSNEPNNIYEWLKNTVHFVIIPVVNPWGIDNKSRYNSRGVDINRNFPFGWTSSSTSGSSAESEKETQIIMSVFSANSNAHLHIEIHTRGGNTLAESVPPFLSQIYTDCPTQYAMQYIQGYLSGYFSSSSGIHRDPQSGEMTATSWKVFGIPSCLIECAHNTEGAGKHTARCDKINTSMVGNSIYRLSQYVLDNAKQIIDAINA